MSYCVNCGVELADSEKKCPLCDTEVIHPKRVQPVAEAPYPPFQIPNEQPMQKSGIVFIISLILIIPALITILYDFIINHAITWSSYVLGACALLYIATIPPIWFSRKSPIVFIVIDVAGAAAYLYLIERMSGGSWFFTFGLPLLLGISAVLLVLVALAMYTKSSPLKLVAGAMMAVGIDTVWVEVLINTAFQVRHTLVWSLYPLSTFIVLGAILLVIDNNLPLKEKLKRKFFI